MRNPIVSKRRIVLGKGHPWFFSSATSPNQMDCIQLTQKPVAQSILLRGGEKTVPLQWKNLGNWNRVRLVIEVIS